jgi:hypothetical protein
VIHPTALLIIPIAVLASTPLRETVPEPCPSGPLIVVSIRSGPLPAFTLVRARHVAAAILAQAGVTIEWTRNDPGCFPRCPYHVGVELKDCAGTGIPRDSIAVSRLGPGSESAIEIFLDRVCQKVERERVPGLLGHVLAHEIVHVLQGIKRHSDQGLMKARWTREEILQMEKQPLKLTAEDIRIIQARSAEAHAEAAP